MRELDKSQKYLVFGGSTENTTDSSISPETKEISEQAMSKMGRFILGLIAGIILANMAHYF